MDMKNIYRIILIIILCTGVLPVCAQGNYYAAMPDVTPPSPTSRVFQSFWAIPFLMRREPLTLVSPYILWKLTACLSP